MPTRSRRAAAAGDVDDWVTACDEEVRRIKPGGHIVLRASKSNTYGLHHETAFGPEDGEVEVVSLGRETLHLSDKRIKKTKSPPKTSLVLTYLEVASLSRRSGQHRRTHWVAPRSREPLQFRHVAEPDSSGSDGGGSDGSSDDDGSDDECAGGEAPPAAPLAPPPDDTAGREPRLAALYLELRQLEGTGPSLLATQLWITYETEFKRLELPPPLEHV